MIPFTKTKLLKPIDDKWDIEDPIWIDDDTLSFYIPTWFNPDEFIKGLNIETSENDDYINVYLNYYVHSGEVALLLTYVNESGYDEGYKDFEISVEMDEISRKIFKEKIRIDWQEALNKDDD